MSADSVFSLNETLQSIEKRNSVRSFTAQDVSDDLVNILLHAAEEALIIVRNDPPDVVLLDFRMPGMDGIEVLNIIKQINPSIEVIMLTGHGDTQTIEQGMKSGAFQYVMKPIDIGELILKINEAVKKRNSAK
jgi:DNA-binding NtrC family response regulator